MTTPGVPRFHLTDFISIEDLQSLQDGFAQLTGISTSIRDENGNALTSPTNKPDFCGLIQSTEPGLLACRASHREAAEMVRSGDAPCMASCHAGLHQSVAPIVVRDHHVGTIIVGDRPRHQLTQLSIEGLSQTVGIPESEIAAAAEDLKPWSDNRMTAATTFIQQLANNIARLCYNAYQLKCRVDDLAALHDVAQHLSGRTELQAILDTAVRQLVDTMELKAAGLRLLNEENGILQMAAVCNLSEEYLSKKAILASESEIDSAALEGQTLYIRDLATDPRNFYQEKAREEGIGSVLVVPLISDGQPIGVMRAYMGGVYEFSEFDVALAEAIASQVASAIVNARLRRDAAEAERLDRQLKLARDVQRRMFPSEMPQHHSYEFGSVYEPHSDVGGDFYDFVDLPSGDIGFAIADVVGKGVPASLIMSSARSALRANLVPVESLSQLMSAVNKRICEDTLISEFVTLFFGQLSRDGRTLHFCNAGHEPLIRYRDGAFEMLDVGGLVLGIDETAEYEAGQTEVRQGDLYVLVTDGVVEASNYDGETYGRERFLESIKRHSTLQDEPAAAPLVAKQIMWDVRRFVGLKPLDDDLTVVVVRVR